MCSPPDVFGSAPTRSAAARRSAMARARVTADYYAFGFDYFDNPDLGIGYGGYRYDGRFTDSAERLMRHYQLNPGMRILEIGCAKGFVLVELAKLGAVVNGLDASSYAVSHCHPDLRNVIIVGDAAALPFPDDSFDLVFAKEVLPHINESDLDNTLSECVRVSRGAIFFEIQCAENKEEQAAIMSWDPTHRIVQSPTWWRNRIAAVAPVADFHFKRLFTVA